MSAETFYQELKRLILSQPKLPTHSVGCEGCEYGDQIYHSKGLYYSFDCGKCVDSLYIYSSNMCANCVDCDYSVESELCYESVDINKCFNCDYLENCSFMTDSYYSYGCVGCHDVFGSVNLRNKSFCIFNRQLTEQEYREKIKYAKLVPYDKILLLLGELKKRYPLTQTYGENNQNSSFGNYVYYCKNCFLCFDTFNSQDSAYIYDTYKAVTSFDATHSAELQLAYESVDSAFLFNSSFVVYSAHCHDSYYLFNCDNVRNSFGCVGLSHKAYCLLNRQLTQEQYEKISKPLLSALQTKSFGWADLVF